MAVNRFVTLPTMHVTAWGYTPLHMLYGIGTIVCYTGLQGIGPFLSVFVDRVLYFVLEGGK